MSGALTPLPNTPSWHGAQLIKHRNTFTFLHFVLLLNECLLLFISLSTQSGNFWIHPRKYEYLSKVLIKLWTDDGGS
jgi:hypothetical protein